MSGTDGKQACCGQPWGIRDDRHADPLGHALLEQRLAAIEPMVRAMLAEPLQAIHPRTLGASSFLVTGTGSSEAHARFLVYLLNRHVRRSAEFMPLSGFCALPASLGRGRVLVVVSQGLSPNAQVALRCAGEFAHTVVFTSTTARGAAAAGRAERAELVRRLQASGVEFFYSPLEEEYATLIRLVGPVAVYVRMLQFASCLEGGGAAGLSTEGELPLLRARAPEAVLARFVREADRFRRGFYLVAGAPLSEFAHNLAYKFLEGLYWTSPGIWDFLQFAHGAFQEVTVQPRPVVILTGSSAVERDLVRRTVAMLQGARVPYVELESTAEAPLSILEYEAVFNDLVSRLVGHFGVDQRNWPSKGRDDPLYGFARVG